MRFFFSRLGPQDTQSVLVIQTCNPDLLGHVVADARRRFPRAHLGVLLQRGMKAYLPAMPSDEQWENLPAGRRDLVKTLRARRFDAVCVVESGERGFWKLKLFPLVLAPRTVWVYDRLAQPTAMSLAVWGAYLHQLLSSGAPKLTARRLAAPWTFWQLWRFYRQHRRH